MIGKLSVKRDLAICRWRVECSICGIEEEDYMGGMPSDFLRDLERRGWRLTDSEFFGQVGVACGDCIADPENDLVPCNYVPNKHGPGMLILRAVRAKRRAEALNNEAS